MRGEINSGCLTFASCDQKPWLREIKRSQHKETEHLETYTNITQIIGLDNVFYYTTTDRIATVTRSVNVG